ncbi:MAG TPA: molybdate ABC transporter substrate-binding protein [Rhodocyclaceae bacterium]|nr:molybdate ABC transporter substrate-binding protein [Rhodocyclaceae bacterium]
MKRLRINAVCLMALLVFGAAAHAETLRIAVAANFILPLQQLAAAFERNSGTKLLLAPGATRGLYAQIRNGAPFDVLLSADQETPQRLVKAGLALPDSEFTYAVGKLALWSARPGYVDAGGRVLGRGDFAHLAIANSETAPYGAAALSVIEHLGLLARLRPRLVEGENITQAYQFVASGNAELGFVALSSLVRNGKLSSAGSLWVVPAGLYPPIRQDAVILARAKNKPAARALMAYLKSAPARAIIKSYGYDF